MESIGWEGASVILAIVALLGGFGGWVLAERRAARDWKLAKQEIEERARDREEVRNKEALEAEEKKLRTDDVLVWGLSAIRAMQTAALYCGSDGVRLSEKQKLEKLADIAVELSVLLEQGRLYFRNDNSKWGLEKEPAYRGIRPQILDKLLLGYQVTRDWADMSAADQKYASQILIRSTREFLSHVQKEVGRDRTASGYNTVGGDGVDLAKLIYDAKSAGLAATPYAKRH